MLYPKQQRHSERAARAEESMLCCFAAVKHKIPHFGRDDASEFILLGGYTNRESP